jgi:carbon monoxide dehydrogenase subunit G
MLHFEGDNDFPRPPAEVFAKLSDARFLVECIPGVEKVARAEQQEAVCVLRPGFSFVRGTLEITLKIAETVPVTRIGVQAHGKGIGSSNDVIAVLELAPQDAGTRVHWSADVTNLGGLLRAIPQGLLRGAGQKVIADVWTQVKEKLV